MYQREELETFESLIASKGLARVQWEQHLSSIHAICERFNRFEQEWLDGLIPSQYSRLPRVLFGFYESHEFQARCFEYLQIPHAAVAVSAFCLVSLGNFFRSALAHRSVLSEFGNAEAELLELPDGPHLNLSPRDPERKNIADLLGKRAMRFLTAHELTHILNGHLLCPYGVRRLTLAERPEHVVGEEALFRQTLEMDADAGAVLECLPSREFLNSDTEEIPEKHGLSTMMANPADWLFSWLFGTYCLFRILADDAPEFDPSKSTHPPPMMRIYLIQATLHQIFSNHGLERLRSQLPGICERTIREGEQAFGAAKNTAVDIGFLAEAVSPQNLQHSSRIIQNWKNVRPLLECHARGRRLAPLP
jgi:hypothetical protein